MEKKEPSFADILRNEVMNVSMKRSKIAGDLYELVKPKLLSAAKYGDSTEQVDLAELDIKAKLVEANIADDECNCNVVVIRIIELAKMDGLVATSGTRPDVLVFRW